MNNIIVATEAIICSQAVLKRNNRMEQGKYEKHLHDKLKEDVQQLRRELILRQDANKTELLNYYQKEAYIKTMAFTLIAILVLVLLIIICFSQPSKMNGMYNHVFMLISHSSLATIQ